MHIAHGHIHMALATGAAASPSPSAPPLPLHAYRMGCQVSPTVSVRWCWANPRPDGTFPDRPCLPNGRGGGVSLPPPLLSATLLERFSVRKRHLIAPGFPEYAAKFYLKVTEDVTGRVKRSDFLLSVIARFAGQSSRTKLN